MLVKDLIEEDFTNYKLPSMLIATCQCDWKCPRELGLPVSLCQNSPIANQKNIEVSAEDLFSRYSSNPLTQALIFAGLEPMLQVSEIIAVISYFRDQNCNDPVIIYTGYYPDEIDDQLAQLRTHSNIIVKFGRFIPNEQSHYDEVLGVNLVSNNQYAEQIC